MKILIVCENYFPNLGGVEIFFKNIAERLVKKGHQVTIITRLLPKTKQKENINQVTIIRVPSFNSRYFFTFFSIPTILKYSKKADIIHTTTFNGAPPAWLVGKLRNIPTILTVHEVWVNRWNQVTDLSKFSCIIHNFLEKLLYKLPFSHYVCVSNSTSNQLKKINIPKNKISTIHNGLDYNFWNPKNFKNIRKQLNLETKFIYFAWGRPGPSKGFEYLLKAVPLISKKIPNSILLLMLGNPEKYPKQHKTLKSLIKRINPENICLLPSVPYEQLGNYIKTADCVVVPSIAEGFGYTTVETAAIGTPLVVSNIDSLPEVVSGKFNLFEPKNPKDLATQVYKTYQQKWQTKTKKFLWEATINQYEKLYQNIAKIN